MQISVICPCWRPTQGIGYYCFQIEQQYILINILFD